MRDSKQQELTISVVIPTYNRDHLIGRALLSVLREIGPRDEVIVVDDGSTDATESVVAGLRDARVRYIRQENAGAGVARNRGVGECRGDLIAFLDSDDEWLPGRVAVQRKFMAARPDVLFSFTDMAHSESKLEASILKSWQSDENGWPEAMGVPAAASSVMDLPPGIADFDIYSADIYLVQMKASYMYVACMMVRRQEAGNALRFTEGVPTYEDWECFGRLAGKGRMAHLTFIGAMQHKHDGTRLTQSNWLHGASARIVVLKNVWGTDRAFLAGHAEEFHQVLRHQTLLKIRNLLILGRPKDARGEIANVPGIPVLYRAASWVPGNVLTSFVRLRRYVRRSAA